MADNLSPIWSPLVMHQYSHPDNLPEPNRSIINLEQRTKLDEKLIQLRREQLDYLSSHPEIRGIIREFYNHLLNFMPTGELIPKFCRDFFSQCRYELKLKVDRRTNEILKKTCHKHDHDKVHKHDHGISTIDLITDNWNWTSGSSGSEEIQCEI